MIQESFVIMSHISNLLDGLMAYVYLFTQQFRLLTLIIDKKKKLGPCFKLSNVGCSKKKLGPPVTAQTLIINLVFSPVKKLKIK